DGYIQDRLNNPVHIPQHGTVKAVRLEAPTADLVRRVVEARLRPCLNQLPEGEAASDITPFVDEQVMRVAVTEPTLRDMLQQFRPLFDHVIYGPEDLASPPREQGLVENRIADELAEPEAEEISFKSVDIVETTMRDELVAAEIPEPEPATPVLE